MQINGKKANNDFNTCYSFKSRITNAKILKQMNVISLVCFTVSNDFILFILKLIYVIKKISYLKDYLNGKP